MMVQGDFDLPQRVTDAMRDVARDGMMFPEGWLCSAMIALARGPSARMQISRRWAGVWLTVPRWVRFFTEQAVLPVEVQHVECFDLAMPGERPVIVDDGCTVVVGRTHLV